MKRSGALIRDLGWVAVLAVWVLAVEVVVKAACAPMRAGSLPRHSLSEVLCGYPDGRPLKSGMMLIITIGSLVVAWSIYRVWKHWASRA